VTRYLLKRLGLAVVTLWLLSVIVFFAGQVVPGDPGRAILGNLADPRAVRALDHQLGVDRPLLTQYWSWITGLLHGNMGESYQYRSAVEPYVQAALVNSVKLAALAFVIVVRRHGARVRVRDRGDHHFRGLAEVAARVGVGWHGGLGADPA
jgi:peptide/nickel transport system permease protein